MPKLQRGGRTIAQYLPRGTLISNKWDVEYIEAVRIAEEQAGRAICGGKKRKDYDPDKDPLWRWPCRQAAGYGTDHPGEGRCSRHGGSNAGRLGAGGQHSILRHRSISMKVEAYLESQELMDIRHAVATAWAALDEALTDTATIDMERASELVSAMSRIGTLIKQHNDVTEGQRLVIDVPQFMEWAEFLYLVAIKHIQEVGGDPARFLKEAQRYYTSAIGSVIGQRNLALGDGHPDEAEDVLRPGE